MSQPAALPAMHSLLRMATRTLFSKSPKQILIVDTLLVHSVCNLEDFCAVFPNTQPKEVRALLNPLLNFRLVSKGVRTEVRDGATRSQQRDYYYINFWEAVDAVKFKLVKLAEKVADTYKTVAGKEKDWSCPCCKAEYDELAILPHLDPIKGYVCEKCGYTLVQNEAAVKERGEHAKIRKLNDQLRPFNILTAAIDADRIPENTFDEAWEKKRDVPRDHVVGSDTRAKYVGVEKQRGDLAEDKLRGRTQTTVKADELGVSIASEREQKEQEEEAKRLRDERLAKQNVLPEWHTSSTVTKREVGSVSPASFLKKEEEDGEKPLIKRTEDEQKAKIEEDLDDFVAQIEREKAEEERRKAEESDDDEEDDEDDFEDVTSAINTPASSAQRPSSLKRERDLDDGHSVSGTDTNANTPMPSTPLHDAKRLKLENDNTSAARAAVGFSGSASMPSLTQQSNGDAADSEEDDEFEDV